MKMVSTRIISNRININWRLLSSIQMLGLPIFWCKNRNNNFQEEIIGYFSQYKTRNETQYNLISVSGYFHVLKKVFNNIKLIYCKNRELPKLSLIYISSKFRELDINNSGYLSKPLFCQVAYQFHSSICWISIRFLHLI